MHPTKGFDDSHIFRNRQYICTSFMCHAIFDPRDVEYDGKLGLRICPICKQGFLANFINIDNLEYRNWLTQKQAPYNGFAMEDPFNAVSPEELEAMTKEEKARIAAMGPQKKIKESLT